MNIKKAAAYLFSGVCLAFFSAACCGPHPGPVQEGPDQKDQQAAAPAVMEEVAASEVAVEGEAVMAEPTVGDGAEVIMEEGASVEEAAAPVAEGEMVVEEMSEPTVGGAEGAVIMEGAAEEVAPVAAEGEVIMDGAVEDEMIEEVPAVQ